MYKSNLADFYNKSVSMKYTYKYIGDGEVEVPSVQKVVKSGEEFESDTEISNEEFQLVQSQAQPVKKIETVEEEKEDN